MRNADRLVMGNGKPATDMLEALGVDLKGVRGFTLRCYAGEIVTLEISRYVYSSQVPRLTAVLERYNLVPEEAEVDATELRDQAVRHAIVTTT